MGSKDYGKDAAGTCFDARSMLTLVCAWHEQHAFVLGRAASTCLKVQVSRRSCNFDRPASRGSRVTPRLCEKVQRGDAMRKAAALSAIVRWLVKLVAGLSARREPCDRPASLRQQRLG